MLQLPAAVLAYIGSLVPLPPGRIIAELVLHIGAWGIPRVGEVGPKSSPQGVRRLPRGYREATERLPRGYREVTERLPRG